MKQKPTDGQNGHTASVPLTPAVADMIGAYAATGEETDPNGSYTGQVTGAEDREIPVQDADDL